MPRETIADARDIGESVADALFRPTGRFAPELAPSSCFNERMSPARAALIAGEAITNADAIERAADVIQEEIEDEARFVGRYGPLSGAAKRHA